MTPSRRLERLVLGEEIATVISFFPKATLPAALRWVCQSVGLLKESVKMTSPLSTNGVAVGATVCKVNGGRVGVGGNQTMVGVGVDVSVGVAEGSSWRGSSSVQALDRIVKKIRKKEAGEYFFMVRSINSKTDSVIIHDSNW